MDLDREHVLARGQDAEKTVEVEVLDSLVHFVPVIRVLIESRGGALVVHAVAARHLEPIEVGDETVVVGHLQEQILEGERVGDSDGAPQVHAEIVPTHVTEYGPVIAVSVPDPRGAAPPGAVVEVGHGPSRRRFAALIRGRLFGSLEVLPARPEADDLCVVEFDPAIDGGGQGALREGLDLVGGYLADKPAGERLGQFLDVGLVVVVVDAEREKLEDFAGVVFVRLRLEVGDIVQIDQHRRAGGAVEKQVTDIPQGVVVEKLVFEVLELSGFTASLRFRHRVGGIGVLEIVEVLRHLVVIGREVVLPELGQHRLQLFLGVDPADVDQLLQSFDAVDQSHRLDREG